MTTIQRIEIAGFKSIGHQAIELRRLNVIIGPNGAGKSNLVGAFRLLGEISEGRLQEYVPRQGGASRLLHHGPKHSQEISMSFAFGRNEYRFVLAPTQGDGLFFRTEGTVFRGDVTPVWTNVVGRGHLEARLPADAQARPGQVSDHVMRALRDWRVFHFHDTSDTAPPKRVQDTADNRGLRADAGNLAAFLYRLSQQFPDALSGITETVQRVAPFFAEFRLAPLALSPDKIKLEWRQRGSDAYFDGSALSDGTLRFICLATLLLQPVSLRPSVILLDEPELGLHPAALTLLVELLRNAAARTQVVAATQSVTLLDQLTPDEVIVAEQRDGTSEFRRLEEAALQGWMEEYSLGELWLKNVIGGRPD